MSATKRRSIVAPVGPRSDAVAPGEAQRFSIRDASRSAVCQYLGKGRRDNGPLRFPFSAWPMKLSLASLPRPWRKLRRGISARKNAWRCSASRVKIALASATEPGGLLEPSFRLEALHRCPRLHSVCSRPRNA